ncbi:D-alanyl-D-alanine carboxypeptidase family protein [Verrucomicrobiota bacterium]
MKINIISCFLGLACLCLSSWTVHAAPRAQIDSKSADPYMGAIVIDAATGQIFLEDHSDVKGYPASIVKMMDLLICLEKINTGTMRLNEKITISAEASKMGGSQVFLKENEIFTVDELLYACMVQSANDAATALAIHAAGSKEGFVALMNQRAKELGMKSTKFHSIHGLPPAKGQLPDVTTARDLTRLARELLKYPDCLRYTSCRERMFRDNKFEMRNHNQLLWSFPGCDGFKTGYFTKAGYSIVATAKRDNNRVIAVVLGSTSKKLRNSKASELLNKGLTMMPEKPVVIPVTTNVADQPIEQIKQEEHQRGSAIWLVISITVLVILAGAIYWVFFYRPDNNDLVKKP